MEGKTRKGLVDCEKGDISIQSKIIVGNKGIQELYGQNIIRDFKPSEGKPFWIMTTVRVWPWVCSSGLSRVEELWS